MYIHKGPQAASNRRYSSTYGKGQGRPAASQQVSTEPVQVRRLCSACGLRHGNRCPALLAALREVLSRACSICGRTLYAADGEISIAFVIVDGKPICLSCSEESK